MPKNVALFTAQGRKFGCWGKGPGVKPPPRVELLATWNSTSWRCEKRSLELVDFFWLKVFRGKMWKVFEYDLLLQMTKLVSMSFGSTWAKAVARGMKHLAARKDDPTCPICVLKSKNLETWNCWNSWNSTFLASIYGCFIQFPIRASSFSFHHHAMIRADISFCQVSLSWKFHTKKHLHFL